MRYLIRVLVVLLISYSQGSLTEQVDYMLKPRDTEPVISFKEAIKRSLEAHESLKHVTQKSIVIKSEYFSAFSRILPSLSAKASHDVMAHDDKARFSIGASFPIFDAKNIFTVRARKEATLALRDTYEREQHALIYDVAQTYIAALIAHAQAEVAREEYRLYQRQVSNMERLAALSNVRASIVHKISYQMERAFIAHREKELHYQKMLGALGAKIVVDEAFLVEPVEVSLGSLATNEEALWIRAQKAPDVRALKRELEVSRFMVLAEKLDFLPKINASLDGGLLLPKPTPIRLGDDVSMRAFINVELPLFSGGETLASIRAKVAERTMRELALSQKSREKQLALYALIRQMKELEEIKAAADRAFLQASLAHESTMRIFKAGEVTDAGRELVEAIGNYVHAKNFQIESSYNLETARIRLLLATGSIKNLLD